MGRVEIVECLLQNKAQVDMGDFGGVTALIVACASGHAAVVASLLKAGADPEFNVHGEDGVISPMTEAKAEANQDCVDLLRAAISAKKLLPRRRSCIAPGILTIQLVGAWRRHCGLQPLLEEQS